MCSSPWARKESDKTKLLNETELNPLQYSDGHELAHGLMNMQKKKKITNVLKSAVGCSTERTNKHK